MPHMFEYPTRIHKWYHSTRKKLKEKPKYNEIKRWFLQRKYRTHQDCYTLTWVDPKEIQLMQIEHPDLSLNLRFHYDAVALHEPDKGRFNPTHCAGLYLGGDWDKFVKPYNFDRVYTGLQKYLEEDIPFEETEYGYEYLLREETYQVEGYAQDQIQTTMNLIDSMKENGFKTRYELGQLKENEPPYLQKDQWGITVNVDRDGNYIFNNTAHNRLALSKLLGLDKIPVTVVVKHSDLAPKWKDSL